MVGSNPAGAYIFIVFSIRQFQKANRWYWSMPVYSDKWKCVFQSIFVSYWHEYVFQKTCKSIVCKRFLWTHCGKCGILLWPFFGKNYMKVKYLFLSLSLSYILKCKLFSLINFQMRANSTLFSTVKPQLLSKAISKLDLWYCHLEKK